MKSEKVPGKLILPCIGMDICASSLALTSSRTAGNDSWIALLIALGLSLLLVWLYSEILLLHPGKGLYDILLEIFGNVWGKIFCVIYAAYGLFLGSEVVRVLNEFIQLVNLPNTPQLAILMLMIPLIVWQVRSGFHNIANCARFLYPFLLLFVVSSFLLGTKFMNVHNLQPVLGTGLENVTKTTLTDLMIPLGHIVLAMVPFAEMRQEEKPFPLFAKGIFLGGLLLLPIILRDLLILGAPMSRMYPFSSYDAVNVISVGDFITSIAVLVGINLALASEIKISLSVYTGALGVAKVLGLKNQLQPAAPCCLVMAAVGYLLYDNLLTGLDFLTYIPFYSFPFEVLLPLLILIVGKAKQAGKKKKRATGGKPAVPPPQRQTVEE
jgi:spore germination protein KB